MVCNYISVKTHYRSQEKSCTLLNIEEACVTQLFSLLSYLNKSVLQLPTTTTSMIKIHGKYQKFTISGQSPNIRKHVHLFTSVSFFWFLEPDLKMISRLDLERTFAI